MIVHYYRFAEGRRTWLVDARNAIQQYPGVEWQRIALLVCDVGKRCWERGCDNHLCMYRHCSRHMLDVVEEASLEESVDNSFLSLLQFIQYFHDDDPESIIPLSAMRKL